MGKMIIDEICNYFKKGIFVTLLSIILNLESIAQQEFHYNFDTGSKLGGSAYTGMQAAFNASLLLPIDNTFRQFINGGIGANVQLKYLYNSQFAIGAFGSFNLLGAKTPTIGQTNTLIHFGGLFEYFLLQKNSSPYLGLDVGNYIFTQNTSASTGQTNSNNSVSYSNSSFGIGPNFGFVYNLNPNMLLNANLKYNHVFNNLITSYSIPSQFLQISVGLVFNLSYRPSLTDEE